LDVFAVALASASNFSSRGGRAIVCDWEECCHCGHEQREVTQETGRLTDRSGEGGTGLGCGWGMGCDGGVVRASIIIIPLLVYGVMFQPNNSHSHSDFFFYHNDTK